MNGIFTAGNAGQHHRSDCSVLLESRPNGALDIQVESSVTSQSRDAIKITAEEVFGYFGIKEGKVLIKDQGAPEFVLTARIEACIKQAIDTKKNFLVKMIPENRCITERQRIRRTRLYVPGNSPKMISNAGRHHPHAIVLDLEDSVFIQKKPEARLLVRNALRQVDFCGAERMVRINQLPMGLEDLGQIIPHFVRVVQIPKCTSADEIRQVNETIDQINQRDRTELEVLLIPIIENAKGVVNANEIVTAADNVIALSIGLEDYTADIGAERTLEGTESFYARSHLLNICKAHGKQVLDSVFSDVGDMEGLAATVKRAKALGFDGMGCIHPQQVRIIHDGFSPTKEEIEKAKKIIMAFEEAKSNGLGVTSLGTKMIDPPVVERAVRIIEQANSMKKS